MTTRAMGKAIIRVASAIVPRSAREDWLREWRSELWYVAPCNVIRFSCGAFRDAAWMRYHGFEGARQAIQSSPLTCLLTLAVLGVVAVRISVGMLANLKQTGAPYWQFGAQEVPAGCVAMAGMSCLLMPVVLVARESGTSSSLTWPLRLRVTAFLLAKLALLQPIMFCGLLGWVLIEPVAPLALFVVLAAWMSLLFWAFRDQRRRCPVCLRPLTGFVRVGSGARTFLDCYGTAAMCSRGHGWLHDSEFSTSCVPQVRWLAVESNSEA